MRPSRRTIAAAAVLAALLAGAVGAAAQASDTEAYGPGPACCTT
ncbi:hypothetical protein [Aquipuribacter nitratireducens]|uniref:Uncharacterized protein n=1 Tax=Aquipuribacter nitratireducens TaxID=650104 RepID=A0ABW0GKA0_9MICO